MRKKALMIEAAGRGRVCHSTFHICHALHGRGMDVTLLTTRDYELDGFPAKFDVVKLFPDKSCFVFPFYFCSIIKHVRKMKPDVVHFQWFPSAILGLFLIRLLRMFTDAKIVYTPHNILPHRNRFRDVWAWARIYKSVDSVIVHSDYYKAILSDIFEVENARVFVLPDTGLHGGSLEGIDAVESRMALNLPVEGKLILFFGYMNSEKGVETLIDAFVTLKKTVLDAKLALAGEPCGDSGYREELMGKRRLSEDIFMDLRYIPFDTMVRYFAAADVVALPYLKVCQSPILSLARALGKLVVTTDLAWPGKNDGVIKTPPGDTIGLATALEKALTGENHYSAQHKKEPEEANPWWKPVIETLTAAYSVTA
ncbi:MAG: glycosyltransferase family 4 protein [Nitrospinae bacterium]|nr:glycosyltransferase family 4 protein [Nitrospinota bacterium]